MNSKDGTSKASVIIDIDAKLAAWEDLRSECPVHGGFSAELRWNRNGWSFNTNIYGHRPQLPYLQLRYVPTLAGLVDAVDAAVSHWPGWVPSGQGPRKPISPEGRLRAFPGESVTSKPLVMPDHPVDVEAKLAEWGTKLRSVRLHRTCLGWTIYMSVESPDTRKPHCNSPMHASTALEYYDNFTELAAATDHLLSEWSWITEPHPA